MPQLSCKENHRFMAQTKHKGGLADKLILFALQLGVAGVPIARLTALTGSGRIVRVMPNTPALVGEGAAGYSLAPEAQAAGIVSCRQPMDKLAKACFQALRNQRKQGETWVAHDHRIAPEEPKG